MKTLSYDLYVPVDIYGTVSHHYEVFNNAIEVSKYCNQLNADNTDIYMQYEPLPLYYYTQVLSGNFKTILDAYNHYHSDYECFAR